MSWGRLIGPLALLVLLAVPLPLDDPGAYPANFVHWIVIHHAASGSEELPAADGAASADISAAQIDALHRQRGFDEIGYHYVVRFDGTVEKGRAEDLRGAHARAWDSRGVSYNAASIGVCFAGNCDSAGWTVAQQAGGYRLIRELMRRYGVPAERVIGHRECGMNTHCPGELIDMDAVRRKLARPDADSLDRSAPARPPEEKK